MGISRVASLLFGSVVFGVCLIVIGLNALIRKMQTIVGFTNWSFVVLDTVSRDTARSMERGLDLPFIEAFMLV